MNHVQVGKINIICPDDTDVGYSKVLQEMSEWPDWKVASLLDKDNDSDISFYRELISVRKVHA